MSARAAADLHLAFTAAALALAMSPLLVGCSAAAGVTGAMLKASCTLYADFTPKKCVVYPKAMRKPHEPR